MTLSEPGKARETTNGQTKTPGPCTGPGVSKFDPGEVILDGSAGQNPFLNLTPLESLRKMGTVRQGPGENKAFRAKPVSIVQFTGSPIHLLAILAIFLKSASIDALTILT
jgi:hypothetical protein